MGYNEYFPEGYREAEDIYCAKESDALFASKAHYKSPEKAMLRKALQNKRAEFRKKWFKGKVSV